MDGLEAVRRIRASDATWAGAPVIVLTADAMSGDRQRYLGMGMTGYVSKPIDQRELLGAVASALQGAHKLALAWVRAVLPIRFYP